MSANAKIIYNRINIAEITMSMGALLLEAGKISPGDADRIVAMQKLNGLRFGDAAKALGLINDEDIQKVLSRQFDFPFLTAKENHVSKELVAAYRPFSAEAEDLRALRGQLMLRWFNESHKALALVSPASGEGRSYMAANLAIAFSQLGERTLLVDADLRQPRQHKLFKLKGGYGLSDLLAGRADLSVIRRNPDFRYLWMLPAGTVPPNPVELISRGLKNCLEPLRAKFDVILIDTPSADTGIESQLIASICGGALLLARQNKTALNDLHRLKAALLEAGSQCLGAVLTDFENVEASSKSLNDIHPLTV